MPSHTRVHKDGQFVTEPGWIYNKTDILGTDESAFSFVGEFAKLRRGTISFIMFVCPSVRPSVPLSSWNNSAPTRRIFMKYDIGIFFPKSFEEIPVLLKSDQNNGYFT